MQQYGLAVALLSGAVFSTSATSIIPAGNPMVDWSGRHVVNADRTVSFDWLGVTARLSVTDASYVSAVVTSDASTRGTRIKVYMANQGFPLYPLVQFWVPPTRSAAGNATQLAMGSLGATVITLENIVDPQYGTGVTTFHSFETDGAFVAAPPRVDLPTGKPVAGSRNIEIIGDSITAATNVVRPEFAPSCGDGGFQSDWSQSYSGLLCHRFGASCSTVAVGGKCVMRECGGLQMPDYFTGAFYRDAPKPTYDFKGTPWKPDAMVIDLGTNDMRAIGKIGYNSTTGTGPGMDRFAAETVEFMKTAVALYGDPGIEFFLTAGPMENATITGTSAAVKQGIAAGLKVTLIDMTAACASARQHGNSDLCDGCAGHPGIEGHRGMYEAAWPVIQSTMGW